MFSKAGMDKLIELNSANTGFAQKAHQIALKGANDIVNRQSAAIKETFDQLSSLYQATDWTANATDIVNHQQEYAKTTMSRAIDHVRIAMELAAETNESAFQLAKEALTDFGAVVSEPTIPQKK